MTESEQARWNTESAALLALSEMHGVSYWSLYKVAQKRIRFRDIITSPSLTQFESQLGVKLHRAPYYLNENNWPEFRDGLISAAKNLLIHYHSKGYKILHYGAPNYPQKLSELENPPFWIFTQGNASLLNNKCVGIVGTREPSHIGLFLTQYVAANFINTDYSIVSGLAYGIDQAAHNASLLFNIPTIAVLGTGVNSNYPKNSDIIREKIIEGNGLIITEYLPNQKPSKENFVRRNRIQAALSDILVPVEWNLKSGTAHTVRKASELKRKILCPLLRDSKISEEITYALNEYSAILLSAPLASFKELESLLNTQTNNKTQQLSLLEGD
ncbi:MULTISPECIES: DNA-processing protein DprA [Serratia]|uniref:DNA processing protein DprA n=1 Tax=Serratia marcescens TaxID=615 RepID=A0A656VKD1_SERMA|nr:MULTISPECIES: DNA-processing protein DprA [Serratia]KMU52775.1 DNA processing protein DprA [Serratia marcescens]MBH3190340.1 DNA-protecting protein DprA [Serratia marcescens]MBU5415437.1 DNA-protecting protein DprA [Serratia ureilytica]NMQ38637.1 DNA-processing protein DprA [Serratia marcescens]